MAEGASMVMKPKNGAKEKSVNCGEFRQQLMAFLSRDLPTSEELMMEQHRDLCAECREVMERLIPIDCMHVFQHVSGYIDNEVSAELRARMEAHFKECKHCVAVLDGTRNIIQLVGDETTFNVPPGFSERLYQKIFKKSQ